MTASLLLLLAGCALSDPDATGLASTTGTVTVRVLAPACEASPSSCGDTAAVEGLAGAVVWSTTGDAPPRRGSLTCSPEGLEPAVQVLPGGSTLALANATDGRLAVQWNAGGVWDSAVLAPQAGRVLHLPRSGEVQIVADGQFARVFVGGTGAVTDAEGRADLHDLPAGPRTLYVDHPRFGRRSVAVDVPPEDRVVVEVELRPDPPVAVADGL